MKDPIKENIFSDVKKRCVDMLREAGITEDVEAKVEFIFQVGSVSLDLISPVVEELKRGMALEKVKNLVKQDIEAGIWELEHGV